jgi:hypothetical protein
MTVKVAEMECRYCKKNAQHLIALALLETFGAKVYPSSTFCAGSPSKEHDFPPETAQEKTND